MATTRMELKITSQRNGSVRGKEYLLHSWSWVFKKSNLSTLNLRILKKHEDNSVLLVKEGEKL